MIIFLYGEDVYRSYKKLNEIIEHYKKSHKSGLNLRHINCEEFNLDDLKNEFQTVSMFKEKKLMIFKNTFSGFKKDDKFLNLIKVFKNLDDVVLIYEDREVDERTSLFKALKKHAKSQEFEVLGGERLRQWIKKEIDNYASKIEPNALDKLINYVGGDLWQMDNEIKKLVNYNMKKIIKAEDVELLVKPKIESDIFKTIDAIALKDKKMAISLIHEHLDKGDSPSYLLSMINYQFRNLLMIKDLIDRRKQYLDIVKISKLHPFVVKKSWQQVNKFSLDELKKIYQKIFEVDLSIKTGRIKPEVALDLLITEL